MLRFKLGMATVMIPLAVGFAGAQDKALSIKEIMTKLNKAPAGIYPTLSKQLKADAPSWESIQSECKTFVEWSAALGKNEPPKGEKTSWKALSKAYADNAKALEAAASKKDKAGAQAALAKLGNNACGTCHKAHKK